MGIRSRDATVQFHNGGPPDGSGLGGLNGAGPNFERDMLVSQMRAAGDELAMAERFGEVATAIQEAPAGQQAQGEGWLVDAAHSPFAGSTVLETGTGGMGLSHILEEHLGDMQRQNLVNTPQDAFDFVMHTIRTGEVVQSTAASGGSGTTFTVRSHWRYQNPLAKITVNAKGEIVQFNTTSRDDWS